MAEFKYDRVFYDKDETGEYKYWVRRSDNGTNMIIAIKKVK